ncbi:hypothetical protein CXG81DRAFT_25257 [Caulochytrium protostelioides]|uniref:GH26 domain-containing protein n=1 Tax=Caulochytrium protostelioides TaxID=1555241 RepID=A0A4P9XAI4_9FUNG|nr:hypothetical protein CXG81DRAFT_25257 [Caulochytrium protostelioides]|eukprot:RKP02101.1 hypothetical protein CXG81DRAFT_25257 [Caulochytrium protostelioides]
MSRDVPRSPYQGQYQGSPQPAMSGYEQYARPAVGGPRIASPRSPMAGVRSPPPAPAYSPSYPTQPTATAAYPTMASTPTPHNAAPTKFAVSNATGYPDNSRATQYAGAGAGGAEGGKRAASADPARRRRRRRRRIIWALAILVPLVIAGVVLGVVFGLRSKNDPKGKYVRSGATGTGSRSQLVTTLDVNPDSLFPGQAVGGSLDWAKGQTPAQFNSNIKHRAGYFDSFYHFDKTLFDKIYKVNGTASTNLIGYQADMIRQVNGVFLLTMMPDVDGYGLQAVIDDKDKIVTSLADTCLQINSWGIPILFRFGHEMNGNWYPYAGQPALFKKAWRSLHDAINKVTSQTYFLWSPNYSSGYPYGVSSGNPSWNMLPGTTKAQAASANDAARFAELDTNKDGVFNELDDPFTPYWPSEAYVDWVGASIYGYNGTNPDQNGVARAGFLRNAITTGASQWIQGSANVSLYHDFSAKYNKPFLISETSAPSIGGSSNGVSELQMKQAWWQQVWPSATNDPAFATDFPLYKGACWFEVDKVEEGQFRTFSLTAAVRTAFSNYITSLVSSKTVTEAPTR